MKLNCYENEKVTSLGRRHIYLIFSPKASQNSITSTRLHTEFILFDIHHVILAYLTSMTWSFWQFPSQEMSLRSLPPPDTSVPQRSMHRVKMPPSWAPWMAWLIRLVPVCSGDTRKGKDWKVIPMELGASNRLDGTGWDGQLPTLYEGWL